MFFVKICEINIAKTISSGTRSVTAFLIESSKEEPRLYAMSFVK
jgi:hypothetical protein